MNGKKINIRNGLYYIDVKSHKILGVTINLPNGDPLNDMGYVKKEGDKHKIEFYDGTRMEIRRIEECTGGMESYEQMPIELLTKASPEQIREKASKLERASRFMKKHRSE